MPQRRVGRVIGVARYMRTRLVVLIAAAALALSFVQPTVAWVGPPKFQLPWSDGLTWRLTGGPHSNTGRGKPWSSLDFAGPVSGVSYPVRAAAAGTVVRPCANWVQIRHGNGWETSYYHLTSIKVKAGQHVKRGQLLGYTSRQAGCGGSATGKHVHFSIKHNGKYVDIGGFVFGGWKVHDGSSQYLGCLTRNGVRKCAPGGRLYNYGV